MTSRARPGAAGTPVRAGPGAAAAAAGFTLIEMLVVLAVLGLSLGLVLGRGPPRSPTLDARAAAVELAGALRLARAEAIAGNRRVVLGLDPARRGYRVGGGALRPLPPGLDIAVLAAAGEGAVPGEAGIGFLPDGSSSGGRIRLAAGRAAFWIGVDWLTGRVRIAEAEPPDAR